MKPEEKRPGPKFTPEDIAWCVKEYWRPRMLCIEVSWRTLEAAKANPGSLRIIVEDAEGRKVIERPHRPRDEDNAGRTDYDTFVVLRS
jgi:hypothetical protein